MKRGFSIGEYSLKHGDTRGKRRTTEHRIWSNMIDRCTREKSRHFADYGGRGIKVCDRWREFAAFLADMGRKPAGMTLERIDNARGYEPDNCRWATRTEQARNTRKTLFVDFRGERLPLRRVAEIVGISFFTIYHRIGKLGWTLDDALTLPVSAVPRAKKRLAVDSAA